MSAIIQESERVLDKCPQPLPHIWSAEEIIPRMKNIIAKLDQVKEKVVKEVTVETATFDNVMLPVVAVENATIDEDGGAIWMLQYGSPHLATQDAVAEARRLIIEHESSWEAREDMFLLMHAALERGGDKLDRESKLLLDKAILQCRIAGCGALGEEGKKAFVEETLALEKLCNGAVQNIAKESSGVWFTEAELHGVRASDMGRFRNHENNLNEETKIDGKIFVALANGGFRAVVEYATDPEARRRIYLGRNKAFLHSLPIMKQIIEKRQKKAEILGYKSHAHLRMERRLLRSPEDVQALIDKLKTGLQNRADQELSLLQQHRSKDLALKGLDANGKFPPWDQPYYERIIQEERKYDAEAFSEYFPVDTVADAMLGVFESFLGLKFIEVPAEEIGSDKTWHESVRAFAVWDVRRPEREFVGYLYFDLLFRENKFRGAHNVTMEYGYERPDGSRKYPSTILMSAFPTASDTGCALLEHPNVVILFHELGHAIHNLVARTKYARLHGTNLPTDFVEMPSLMLENWCWMPKVLKLLSTHYSYVKPEYRAKWEAKNPGSADPPRHIPDELIEARVKYRFSGEAMWFMGQLTVSQYDLAILSVPTAEAAKALDFQKIWYDISEGMEDLDYSECRADGSEMLSFAHLINDYDMAYYSYLCCYSYAVNVFEAVFAEDPSSKGAWERYRTGILEYGGSHPDVLQLLRELLGHEPTMEPLVARIELSVL